MSTYISYIKHLEFQKPPDREDAIRKYLFKYFNPKDGDDFFIVDPFLLVVNSIREPFQQNKADEKLWSSIISYWTIGLYHGNSLNIRIITTKPIEISGQRPVLIPYHDPAFKIRISACQHFNDRDEKKVDRGKYLLHDRYILKKNKRLLKGLHIGISLEDFRGKDILMTKLDEGIVESLINNFEMAWKNCIEKK